VWSGVPDRGSRVEMDEIKLPLGRDRVDKSWIRIGKSASDQKENSSLRIQPFRPEVGSRNGRRSLQTWKLSACIRRSRCAGIYMYEGMDVQRHVYTKVQRSRGPEVI